MKVGSEPPWSLRSSVDLELLGMASAGQRLFRRRAVCGETTIAAAAWYGMNLWSSTATPQRPTLNVRRSSEPSASSVEKWVAPPIKARSGLVIDNVYHGIRP